MPPNPNIPTNIPNNSEIDKALKEFEMQGGATAQIPQATETPKDPYADLPRMVRLVIKCSGGAIKEQKQAEYVLLVITVLFFGASLFFWFR